MAKTFSQGIAQTRTYLDEVSPKSWTETEVKREYNYAYQKFVTTAMTAYEDFYMTNTQFNLTADQQEYGESDGLPTDAFKIRRLELNYKIASNPTAFRKSVPVNITDVKDTLSSSMRGSASFPYYYTYGFGSSLKIGLIPIPSESGTNAGRLWYIQEVVDLYEITDPLNIPYPDRYADGIALIAAGTLLRKGQQEEASAARYIAEGKAVRMEMQQELEDRISDEAKLISDSIGMDLDFTQPF